MSFGNSSVDAVSLTYLPGYTAREGFSVHLTSRQGTCGKPFEELIEYSSYIMSKSYTVGSRFTIVRMKNNAIINNTRINSILHTHNCKSTFAPRSV